ncbi:MAG: hypothetical protein K6B52_04430, partial [Clostridiales bacterium]|nr:hypothetical protein [Clostridiales bacterium]
MYIYYNGKLIKKVMALLMTIVMVAGTGAVGFTGIDLFAVMASAGSAKAEKAYEKEYYAPDWDTFVAVNSQSAGSGAKYLEEGGFEELDSSALRRAYAAAKAAIADGSAYVSVAGVRKAVQNCQTALDELNYYGACEFSQDEIDALTAELEGAVKALEAKPVEKSEVTSQKSEVTTKAAKLDSDDETQSVNSKAKAEETTAKAAKAGEEATTKVTTMPETTTAVSSAAAEKSESTTKAPETTKAEATTVKTETTTKAKAETTTAVTVTEKTTVKTENTTKAPEKTTKAPETTKAQENTTKAKSETTTKAENNGNNNENTTANGEDPTTELTTVPGFGWSFSNVEVEDIPQDLLKANYYSGWGSFGTQVTYNSNKYGKGTYTFGAG